MPNSLAGHRGLLGQQGSHTQESTALGGQAVRHGHRTAGRELSAFTVPKARGHIFHHTPTCSPTPDYRELQAPTPLFTATLGAVSEGPRLGTEVFPHGYLRFTQPAGKYQSIRHHFGKGQEGKAASQQNIPFSGTPKGLLFK